MQDQAMHVLLVEDDDVHARMVEKSFRQHKQATLDRVCDGLEAIAYLQQQGEYQDRRRPHLILLDLNMPRMSGHEALQKLKTDDDLKKIPVIVLTTSDAENDRSQAYDLYANSYLVKPADFAAFREMIGTTISYWGVWNRWSE